jgi:hypothetical protein
MNGRTEAIRKEADEIRSEFVEGFVNGRINRRNGDVTTEQVEDWENEAARRFRGRYPTLSALLDPPAAAPKPKPEPLGPPISAWSPAPWELS